MLQHNSAMNISSSTLKIFYKFLKFQPTLYNFNRAFFLGKVPGTAHENSISSEHKGCCICSGKKKLLKMNNAVTGSQL